MFPFLDEANFILTANKFINNYASENGGGLKFTYKIPKNVVSLNVFQNNRADIFGKDYASEPFRYWYLGNNTQLSIFFFILLI